MASRDWSDRALACDNAEMAEIERQHAPTMPFSACNDRGVRKAKRKIGITGDQRSNSRDVRFATIKNKLACCEIVQERVDDLMTEPTLKYIGNLCENWARY